MYLLLLTLGFTGPLTVREFPWHQSIIRSVRFVPPSTLSGFLRRILDFKVLNDEEFKSIYNEKEYRYYTLDYTKHLPLGAFVKRIDEIKIHTAYRQGPRSFLHERFSQLFDYGPRATKLALPDLAEYQPHQWDYVLMDVAIGYILTKAPSEFDKIENYGCKIGKNGYAYVKNVTTYPVEPKVNEVETIPKPYDIENNVPRNIDRIVSRCYCHLISGGLAYGFKNFIISFPKKPYKTRFINANGIHISLSVINELGGATWANALHKG